MSATSVRIYKGESKTLLVTITSTDDGARRDLTGATVVFTVKASDGAADPAIIEKAVGDGITLLSQSAARTRGQFEVALMPGDTAALAARKYRYDVWVTLAGATIVVVPPSDFVVVVAVNTP